MEWTTRDGTRIAIRDMGDTHLMNTIAFISCDDDLRYEYEEIMDEVMRMHTRRFIIAK